LRISATFTVLPLELLAVAATLELLAVAAAFELPELLEVLELLEPHAATIKAKAAPSAAPVTRRPRREAPRRDWLGER
jgi:hypothetical protein